MGQSELWYWAIMDLLKPLASADIQKQITALKDKASTQISLAQFFFWYVAFIGSGLWIYGWHWDTLVTCASLAFLHYAGNEDLGYFILANLPFLHLPDSWWKTRESVTVVGLTLPKYLPWVAVSKKVGPVTIPSLWVRLFAGKTVPAGRFIFGCLLSIGIVVGVSFLV